MKFKDYYKILGIEPDADAKAIKAAYRKLARKYHPDMNANEGAEAKFKEVAEAYKVLKDEQLRAEFDELRLYCRHRKDDFHPPPGWKGPSNAGNRDSSQFHADFSDFFNSIFGAGAQSHQGTGFEQEQHNVHGQDVEVELPIFLEETLSDTQKTIEIVIPLDEHDQTAPTKKHLKVTIPQGVMDDERIRLKGQGKIGHRGGRAGDLYLHIRVLPHPLFDVQGHNILITIPLSPWEAALGTKISVPTLDGKIHLTIPPNSQSGDKLRAKGKGLKSKNIIGDLIGVIKIIIPDKTTATTKVLWQELAEKAKFDARKEWSTQS